MEQFLRGIIANKQHTNVCCVDDADNPAIAHVFSVVLDALSLHSDSTFEEQCKKARANLAILVAQMLAKNKKFAKTDEFGLCISSGDVARSVPYAVWNTDKIDELIHHTVRLCLRSCPVPRELVRVERSRYDFNFIIAALAQDDAEHLLK